MYSSKIAVSPDGGGLDQCTSTLNKNILMPQIIRDEALSFRVYLWFSKLQNFKCSFLK
jgi:hypothetical protein